MTIPWQFLCYSSILFVHQLFHIPAGAWRKYNVASTSMQRHDVASTWGDVIFTSCARWDVTFVLSLFILQLSFFWCLWKDVFPDCGISWVSSLLQSNLNSLNTDGSFTMPNSNSFLSPYEILPTVQENKYLGKFSYFIMELYVVCTL